MSYLFFVADALLWSLSRITPQSLAMSAACVVLLYFVHYLYQR